MNTPTPQTPTQNPTPGVPLALFGDLNTGIRQLSANIEKMLARDPDREFNQGEGNVDVNYEATTFSKSERFFTNVPVAGPLLNVEFMSSVFTQSIRVRHAVNSAVTLDFSTLSKTLLNVGLLLEFFKTYRGNGASMGGNPDGSFFLPYKFTQFVGSSAVATLGTLRGEIDAILPLSYRYMRVSLWNSETGVKVIANQSTLFNNTTVLETNFLGD